MSADHIYQTEAIEPRPLDFGHVHFSVQNFIWADAETGATHDVSNYEVRAGDEEEAVAIAVGLLRNPKPYWRVLGARHCTAED